MIKLDEKQKRIVTIVLIVLFFLMFYLGINSEEVNIVAMKAQNICMECIGIG